MAAPPSRIVLVHGFTQTGTSWRPIIERLPAGWTVTAPDLPGHGTAGDLRSDLAAGADQLAGLIGEEPAVVVGYSLGGRTALRLALDHPDAVAGLVLVGATGGIDDPAERDARRRADDELATRIEAEGVEPFLERWLAQPLFAGLVPEADDLAARRANTAAGLAASLRSAGTGTMDPPWWDQLSSIEVPVLVVFGEQDAKFAALGRRLVEGIGPNAETTAIAGVGHAAHLEAPDAFAALVAGWAARTLGLAR
ncbi:alpha/beta fold hydrolase [Aquihabitans daechungensis]|uniref:alpha/beta fold hydrolase n=1 Tax=Aquihabitans daechungensis TaxID=1052257 RepID=UPI003B9E6F64